MKRKRLSPSEWLLKQSKDIKKKHALAAIVLLSALILYLRSEQYMSIRAIHVDPVKVMPKWK